MRNNLNARNQSGYSNVHKEHTVVENNLRKHFFKKKSKDNLLL